MKKSTIQQIAKIECDKERLMKYLFIKVSTVLTGVKPSVLTRYTVRDNAMTFTDYNLFTKHQKDICETLGLDYIELKRSDSDLQILFYDKEVLSKAISESPTKEFLEFSGYEEKLTLEEKLNLLKSRFASESFPHEIGVFLGYPLKDVKGFSEGRTDSIQVPQSMWRVFDSVTESLNKMTRFRKIEAVASDVATRYKSTVKCIERFRTFAGVMARTA